MKIVNPTFDFHGEMNLINQTENRNTAFYVIGLSNLISQKKHKILMTLCLCS